jgi:hypothetical protein
MLSTRSSGTTPSVEMLLIRLRSCAHARGRKREQTFSVNASRMHTHADAHAHKRTHHVAGLCAQLCQADHLTRAHAEGGARAASVAAAAAAFALAIRVAAHAHGGGAAVLRERKVEHVLLKHLRLGRVAACGRGPPGGGSENGERKRIAEGERVRVCLCACGGAHLAALMQKTICLR